MSDAKLAAYLESVDQSLAPTVEALHHAVMTARPDLGVKTSFGMMLYGLNGDYLHWIVAIGATSQAVTLRFLFGSFMRDPEGWFHGGTAALRTVDFTSTEHVDAEVVGAYVREAVSQLGAYKRGG